MNTEAHRVLYGGSHDVVQKYVQEGLPGSSLATVPAAATSKQLAWT